MKSINEKIRGRMNILNELYLKKNETKQSLFNNMIFFLDNKSNQIEEKKIVVNAQKTTDYLISHNYSFRMKFKTIN